MSNEQPKSRRGGPSRRNSQGASRSRNTRWDDQRDRSESRDDRGGRGARSGVNGGSRGAAGRGDSQRRDRDDRGGYERRGQGERGGYQRRDRDEHSGFERRDRNERRGFERRERDDRGGYERRDRNERGGFERRDRNERGGFERRDRNERGGAERQTTGRSGYVRRRVEPVGDSWKDTRSYEERQQARQEALQAREEAQQGREALKKAAQQRPEGGYSLADFDDIPFNPDHRPEGAAPAPERSTEGVRLQKALANAGVASRRVCEQLITQGRVEVNGAVITELGSRIQPETDRVTVDGTPVQFDQTKRYVLLNKPVGVVSSMHDEQGRPDLRQFTQEFDERIYNVGRLDNDSSGLLIMTNDGELAHILSHPSYEISKTYVVKVKGKLAERDLNMLLEGVKLEDGFIQADAGHVIAKGSTSRATLAEVTLHSGKNRIVRRMFDHIGFPVEELVRRSFGPLRLGTLRAGEMRELDATELGKLLRLARKAEAAHEYKTGKRKERPKAEPKAEAMREEKRTGRKPSPKSPAKSHRQGKPRR
ncbi:pseudouridine synthase [Gulosibacter chungangensis]|uniref:Pseudouridine synthase n=1 Tax=Gulosibacter chungangensis TaxID=979746 RepID=A0A7J5BCH7_9MICO|nr:pseudouridine synthase [Gulosibacter chungangensis]KAB1643881.1 pseudouridine synthase [Gulosibacter chungangensis]